MSTETTPRDRIHAKVCPDNQCILEYAEPGDHCKNLDHLIDQVEAAGVAKAYRKLLDIHMDALLTHGGQVAQGVALGVKTVHEMLPPDAAQTVVVEFAESTPGEQS